MIIFATKGSYCIVRPFERNISTNNLYFLGFGAWPPWRNPNQRGSSWFKQNKFLLTVRPMRIVCNSFDREILIDKKKIICNSIRSDPDPIYLDSRIWIKYFWRLDPRVQVWLSNIGSGPNLWSTRVLHSVFFYPAWCRSHTTVYKFRDHPSQKMAWATSYTLQRIHGSFIIWLIRIPCVRVK